MPHVKTSISRLLLAGTAALCLSSGVASAQYNKPDIGSMDKPVQPYEPGEVNVVEQLGAYVPRGDKFHDEEGRDVTLNDYLGHNRPVILWLGYYECPQFCDKMVGGMIRSLKDIKLDSGREYAVLHVSINPNEVPGLAKEKKLNYTKELGEPANSSGWNLLTGSPESIKSLTDSIGYHFKAVKGTTGDVEYAHPAVILILAPDGKVTRYLYPQPGSGDLSFDPQTLRLSLIEASDGKIGSTVDKFLLTCLRWDAHTGKYTKDAIALMKYAGALTVLVMGAILVPLWLRAARAPRETELPTPDGTPATGH